MESGKVVLCAWALRRVSSGGGDDGGGGGGSDGGIGAAVGGATTACLMPTCSRVVRSDAVP
eukprot:364705-Chlamydomonas_euryale.AAC.26